MEKVFTKALETIWKEAKKEAEEKEKEKDHAANALDMVHVASKARIYTVANKVQQIEEPVISTECCPVDAEIPTQEKWNFAMGDLVKVKNYDLAEFKSIQKRTIGWGKRHHELLGKVGAVSSICNEYDCHLQVYYAALGIFAELYAGVLDKLDIAPPNESLHKHKFQPGDVVVVKASEETADVLQRGYEILPKRFLGRLGKVVTVGSNVVLVSFTGTFSTRMNPALLVHSDGEVKDDDHENSKGFVEGQTVIVTRNLKDLIESQKKILEWEVDMADLPGDEVTILLVKKDDVVRVCRKGGKSFNMHTSVLFKTENDLTGIDTGVPFKPGVWVKLKKIDRVREVLKSKKIPLSILEMIALPALVAIYSADLKPGISYDSQYRIMLTPAILESASEDDAKNAQAAKERAKNLSKGDAVCFDIGPPNYVRDLLQGLDKENAIITLMTTVSTLLGFDGDAKAVIQSSDGHFYRVNKKYLTVPSRCNFARPGVAKFGWSDAVHILTELEKCLDEVHMDCQELCLTKEVAPVSLVGGDPPTLRVCVLSPIATFESVCSALEEVSGLRFETVCNGVIIIESTPTFDSKVQVDMSFETKYVSAQSKAAAKEQEKTDENGHLQPTKSIGEPRSVLTRPGDVKQEAVPPPQVEVPDEARANGNQHRNCPCHEYQWLNLRVGNENIRIPYEVEQRGGVLAAPEGDRVERQRGEGIGSVLVTGIIDGVRINDR